METSSTSSSKDLPLWRSRLRAVLIFGLVLFAFDRAYYALQFRAYDRAHGLGEIRKVHGAVLIGSSHVLWDVDQKLLGARLGTSVGMLSIPGGNLESRRRLVEDYAARHGRLPDLIIVEADRYLFHDERYPEGSFWPLSGYYHAGILRDYLRERLVANHEYFALVSQSYSINNMHYLLGARLYDKVATPLHDGWQHVRRAWTAVVGTPAPPTQPVKSEFEGLDLTKFLELQAGKDAPQKPAPVLPGEDPRVAVWRKQYEPFKPRAATPTALAELRRLVELVAAHPEARLVLLETPSYDMFPSQEVEFDRHVRQVLRSLESPRVRYLRLDPGRFERDPAILLDASHMSPVGRLQYTEALAAALGAFLVPEKTGLEPKVRGALLP